VFNRYKGALFRLFVVVEMLQTANAAEEAYLPYGG